MSRCKNKKRALLFKNLFLFKYMSLKNYFSGEQIKIWTMKNSVLHLEP